MGKKKGLGQRVEDEVQKIQTPAPRHGGIPTVEQAKATIARAVADGDVKKLNDLRDVAAAWEQLWSRREGGREVANDGGEIKVRAERGLGQVDAQHHPHGKNQHTRTSGPPELQVHHDTRATWRRLGKVKDKTFNQYVEIARQDQDHGVSTAQIVRIMRSGGSPDKDTTFECYTPPEYIEAAREVLGGIDLDPASSPDANKTVKAKTFFTEDDNGLSQDWYGRVWLNPPYGRSLTAKFVDHAVEQHDYGNVDAAILLLNAYGFDATWFRPLFDYPLCFTDHRIKFYGGGPTFGSLFVYLGQDRRRFANVFVQFGAVLERVEA